MKAKSISDRFGVVVFFFQVEEKKVSSADSSTASLNALADLSSSLKNISLQGFGAAGGSCTSSETRPKLCRQTGDSPNADSSSFLASVPPVPTSTLQEGDISQQTSDIGSRAENQASSSPGEATQLLAGNAATRLTTLPNTGIQNGALSTTYILLNIDQSTTTVTANKMRKFSNKDTTTYNYDKVIACARETECNGHTGRTQEQQTAGYLVMPQQQVAMLELPGSLQRVQPSANEFSHRQTNGDNDGRTAMAEQFNGELELNGIQAGEPESLELLQFLNGSSNGETNGADHPFGGTERNGTAVSENGIRSARPQNSRDVFRSPQQAEEFDPTNIRLI
jgi:hypothetical protein